MQNVIVIGAGMGGLAAAIRLQSQGYQVQLYEQLDQPGGKMHQIKDQGHTFDVGPTLVMWPEAYTAIYKIAGKDHRDYIDIKRLEPMYETVFLDRSGENRHYKMTSDMVQLMKMMEEKGPETAAGFLNYLADIYKRYQVAEKDFIRKPFRDKKDIYNPYMMKQALKLKTFDSADNMLAKYIPDPDIQRMMTFQTLYIGVSPSQGPSLYNILPMIELFYGVYFLKGGMHAMAEGMARVFQDIGGEITYQAKVEEIVIQDQTVQGIQVDGQVIPADYVISNADFPYTMTELVKDQKARGKYTPEYIENMEYSCSCLVFYWGMKRDYQDLETHTFVISEDLDHNIEQIFNGQRLDDPSIYLSILSNGDPEMAPEGKASFYALLPVSQLGIAEDDYGPETIDYYREKVLASLETIKGLEDIRQQIYLEHYFTPHDFKEKFSAYNGATFGLQPILKQSNHWRPQSKSKDCHGLYFTGSSTHPGAGVPTAIEGGRIAADELRLDIEAEHFKP